MALAHGGITAFKTILAYLQGRNTAVGMSVAERDLAVGEGFGADLAAQFRQYRGAVYSPSQDRMYFVPATLDPVGEPGPWHYVNCQTNQLVPYLPANQMLSGHSYWGGAYSPTQNRIYLAPYSGTVSTWHYIDCASDTAVAFAHGQTMQSGAYRGAVYEPVNNRIYFVPYGNSDGATWHYVNCVNGAIVAYSHLTTAGSNAYMGGVYRDGKIYFIPSYRSGGPTWHYIDCSTGSAVSYDVTNIGGRSASMFYGGALDPKTGFLHLAPIASTSTLYYVDTNVVPPVLHSFDVGSNLSGCTATSGAVYSPLQNKLIYVPGGNALYSDANFFSLDLGTLAVSSFPNPHVGLWNLGGSDYTGGNYAPSNNTIYFVPTIICNATLHPILRVQVGSRDVLPRQYYTNNPEVRYTYPEYGNAFNSF